MKELLQLFLIFAKCGVCTFGGGYAMLPILQRELVNKRGWVTDEEITDYYAVGQCTPGVIAVNVSTFIGMKRRGWIGAVFSTCGIVFPSVVIISVIAALVLGFSDNEYVIHALAGVRAAVCGLVAVAVMNLIKKNIKDLFSVVLAILSFICAMFFDVSPVVIVICVAFFGIAYNIAIIKNADKKEKKDD